MLASGVSVLIAHGVLQASLASRCHGGVTLVRRSLAPSARRHELVLPILHVPKPGRPAAAADVSR